MRRDDWLGLVLALAILALGVWVSLTAYRQCREDVGGPVVFCFMAATK